jgi:glycosyltransferase involved in cell wall biosynthesis
MLASTDLLVCPSRTMSYVAEQFGKAPVEAMSLGVPVFAYDCGALREVVGDGGVVVPEGDSARLADEIVAYVTSPDRGALGDAARARAARYDESRLADELARIWAAALDA